MKFIDIYFEYKKKYEEYIVLYLVGNFYQILGEDSKIMNMLFSYKIIEHAQIEKVGFPYNSLEQVKKELNMKKINYLILEKEEGIIRIKKRKKFHENQYASYLCKCQIYESKKRKIKQLEQKLFLNLDHPEFEEIVGQMESLL